MTMTADIATPTPAKARKGGLLRRIVMGGRLSDLGRLPRYFAFALLGGTVIWAPIVGYLNTAPLTFRLLNAIYKRCKLLPRQQHLLIQR